ncbi:MAG: histidine kinase dimerization/phospho-acceptor domain-containing protein, partial [Bacilli bacterium]
MLSKNSTDSKKGKSMSIKNRVSIFYSLVLVLFCISLIVVFFNVVENQSDSVTKKNLAEAVYEAFADIDGDSTTVEVNSDFDKYSKGVTLVLYDEDGNLLLGSTPSKFPASTPLELASYNNVTVDQENWLIFDANETYKNGQTIWVRGIYALDSNASLISAIMLVLLIILPILLAVAIIIGRRITVKAFDPMIDIIESADKIEIGNDVKGRISLPVRKDELYDLSLTLNNMLGRLEAAFEGERQFSSDVTHELKTPLSVILAQCEFILNEPRSSEEYVAAITQIQIDCKRILALSTQLLNISRTINKNELIEKEEINLSVLCESIGEQMEISALEK